MTKDELIEAIKDFPGNSIINICCSRKGYDPEGWYDITNPQFYPARTLASPIPNIVFDIADDVDYEEK